MTFIPTILLMISFPTQPALTKILSHPTKLRGGYSMSNSISDYPLSNNTNKSSSTKLSIREVRGDGNCLFRAVSDQIEGNENNHYKYRQLAVDYIERHRESFEPFMDEGENFGEHVAQMRKSGTWGGHFELVALSEALGVSFCVHIKDEQEIIIAPERTTRKVYHVAFDPKQQHYNSIRGLESTTPEVVEELESVSESEISPVVLPKSNVGAVNRIRPISRVERTVPVKMGNSRARVISKMSLPSKLSKLKTLMGIFKCH